MAATDRAHAYIKITRQTVKESIGKLLQIYQFKCQQIPTQAD